jgi:hypothetical protein
MTTRRQHPRARLIVVIAALALAGCSTTEPRPFEGLSSTAQLRSNPKSDRPFSFRAESADLTRYTNVVVEEVKLYAGADGQFDKVKAEDREIIRKYMQERFTAALAARLPGADDVVPAALRVRATLAGMETSTPVLSTLMRIMPGGLLINAGKSAFGDEGTMMGSITYAVELVDASSGRVVCAFVRKAGPNAMDITATFGYLDASKTGVDRAAKDLLAFIASDCRIK